MAVRSVLRGPVAMLRAFTASAIDLLFASDNSDFLSYKDSTGTVRTLVNADQAQTLTNKTILGPVTALAADGAIPIVSGTYKITKAGVAALTLAAPTAGEEGTRILVTSQTANAHVITATGLLEDGGGTEDIATFTAGIGASIELVAINLKWHTVATPIAVTLS